MDVIATKTKVLSWACVGAKEKIDLEVCDFSPDQVGALDRLLRTGKDERVRVTIEPEQKKLQIPPVACPVRLVSLSCRPGGQKIKLAEFRTPDDRATAMKRLIANETPVVLSIEEIQKQLPFGESGTNAKVTAKRTEATAATTEGDEPVNEPVIIKCKGMRKAGVKAAICHRPGEGHGYSWTGEMGNHVGDGASDDGGHPTRIQCLAALRDDLVCWLRDLEITGTADRRRADGARRDQMREQVEAHFDKLILAADEVPFDEDPPRNEEDQDDGDENEEI